MLGPDQRQELAARGWTRVPGVVAAPALDEMVARVWDFLETRGVRRDDPTGWPDKVGKLQPLRNARVFDAFLDGGTVDAVADQLIGPGAWTTLGVRPQALLTMPTPGPWTLPHRQWHFDLPARGPTDHWIAVRYFGLIHDVGPREGSTLVVEGSHELVRRMVADSPTADVGSSADVRAVLAHHEFFARLSRPSPDPHEFMDRTSQVDGVDVRVAEIVGEAGDLVVMHPWLQHNLSANVGSTPRVAMSYSLYADDAAVFGSR